MGALNANVPAQVTATAVKDIVETALAASQINSFINMSYAVTRPVAGNLGACGGGDTLKQIMLLLSAHFTTLWDRMLKSESIGGEWSASFMGQDGKGLEASLYGQQALALDCSGMLAKAGMKQATFQVADYDQLADLSDDV
jgi:hypothetical protein